MRFSVRLNKTTSEGNQASGVVLNTSRPFHSRRKALIVAQRGSIHRDCPFAVCRIQRTDENFVVNHYILRLRDRSMTLCPSFIAFKHDLHSSIDIIFELLVVLVSRALSTSILLNAVFHVRMRGLRLLSCANLHASKGCSPFQSREITNIHRI